LTSYNSLNDRDIGVPSVGDPCGGPQKDAGGPVFTDDCAIRGAWSNAKVAGEMGSEAQAVRECASYEHASVSSMSAGEIGEWVRSVCNDNDDRIRRSGHDIENEILVDLCIGREKALTRLLYRSDR
jgi:hypothetical protein